MQYGTETYNTSPQTAGNSQKEIQSVSHFHHASFSKKNNSDKNIYISCTHVQQLMRVEHTRKSISQQQKRLEKIYMLNATQTLAQKYDNILILQHQNNQIKTHRL